ncbi:hypothetical protein EV182_003144 [Spiromyces aspiralis]|uniref:Uncharacterized protein n=1 Tax=Spiromyces aspiralis TaxID=68401 RepID=A0ACC1HR07_9FUNG|nr:hypothetical protein EV182_003144 [Spiromyces aspiralis]
MLNSFRTLSGRIKRLPKRSLKPLDFSNIRKQHQNGWKLAVDGSSGSIDQFGRSLGRSQSESHLMVQSSPSFPFPPSPTHESGDLSNRRRPLEASSRKSLAARSNRNSVSVVEPSQENIVVDQNAHCINNNDSDRLRVTQGGNNAKKPASSSSKSLAGKTNNCKYCGKQYRYRSKLKSHEQHCPSKLEALLYSQGDTPEQQALEDSAPREGDTVSCVCGPRRPYSKNTQNVQPGNNAELDSQEMVRCTHCSCWLHRLCVSLVQLVLPDPYCCPNCTLKLSQARPSQEQTMSPESQRLAKLLADVPDTSETEDEDPVTRAAMIQSKRSLAKPEGDSEGTMSLTDVSELARFHRQGKQSTIGRSRKDYETPDFTRLIRSDADFILSNSHHHQQLQSHQSNQHHPGMFHNLYTDNILSSDADFIHISFPFNIDGAAGQGADTNSSASNAAQSQQLAVQTSNAISLASDPPVQWHIDAIQLLGTEHSTANPAAAGFQVPSQASSADGLQVPVGMDLASLLGGSSGGSGGRNSGNSNGTGAGGASGSAAVTAAASAGISGGLYHDLIASDSAFPDLLNQFSNANCTSTATSMLPPALAFPAFSAMTTNGVPLVPQVAGRRSALHDNSDGFIEHGSSSTITIMHDNFSDLVMTSKAPMSEPGSAVSQRQSFGLPSSSIIMPAAAASRGGSNRTNVVAASDKAHNIPTSMSLASGVPLGTGQHPMTDPTNDIRLEQLLTNVTLPQSFQQELPPGSELLDKELEGLINFDV